MTIGHDAAYQPSTQDLRDIFFEEIVTRGGSIIDDSRYGDDRFTRATLPFEAEVAPKDTISAGVALRGVRSEILVAPYTVRRVCTNGAIATDILGEHRLVRLEASDAFLPLYEATVVLERFRERMRACVHTYVVEQIAAEMRRAASVDASTLWISVLSQLGDMPHRVLHRIHRAFLNGSDQSLFGLMNAVTATARTVDDPEVRWRLEAFGGTMPARAIHAPQTDPAASVAVE